MLALLLQACAGPTLRDEIQRDPPSYASAPATEGLLAGIAVIAACLRSWKLVTVRLALVLLLLLSEGTLAEGIAGISKRVSRLASPNS